MQHELEQYKSKSARLNDEKDRLQADKGALGNSHAPTVRFSSTRLCRHKLEPVLP